MSGHPSPCDNAATHAPRALAHDNAEPKVSFELCIDRTPGDKPPGLPIHRFGHTRAIAPTQHAATAYAASTSLT